MQKIANILIGICLYTAYSIPSIAVTTMAAVGDSITSGYPEINCARGKQAYGGYAKYLEPKLDSNGWATTLYNYGIGGDRAEWATQEEGVHCKDEHWKFDGSPIKHDQIAVASGRAPKPEYMLYLFGTNDLGYHSPPTVVNYIKNGINQIIGNDIIPIVGTILPDTRVAGDPKDIHSTNNLLRPWLISMDVQIAEFYNAASNSGWNSMMSDGLHPDNSGRQFMANIWYQALLDDRAKKEAIEEAIKRAKTAAALAGINSLLLLD